MTRFGSEPTTAIGGMLCGFVLVAAVTYMVCDRDTMQISGIARAIDGDTVSVSGTHIRLWGIDAEELNEPNGPAAKRALAGIVNGVNVTCTVIGDKSYDRVVARCNAKDWGIDVLDLGEWMVARGFALDCARYSGGYYAHFEPKDARVYLIQKGYC